MARTGRSSPPPRKRRKFRHQLDVPLLDFSILREYLDEVSSRPKNLAVGYVRVSTEKQAAEGVSLGEQQQQIISFAVASGYEIVDVLSDEGISGSKDEDSRPGLAGVLRLVKEGVATTVIVTKRDRLARSQALAGHVETQIKKAGGVLVILDEAGISDVTRAVLTMVAEVERLLAIQRTKAGMRALKAKGVVLGAVPFGYTRDKAGRLHALPEEGERVEEIRQLRAAGKTLKQIADHLTDVGVPTKRGGRWSPQHVNLILQRPPVSDD